MTQVATQIQLPDLVSTFRYISPIYTRKLEGVTSGSDDRGDWIRNNYAGPPSEDLILGWLQSNCLYRVEAPFKENFHSDFGYVFQGSNGALCVAQLKEGRISGDEYFSPKDHVYRWNLVLKVQPREKDIPKEISDVLAQLNFLPSPKKS